MIGHERSRYAEVSGIPKEEARVLFASRFAVPFLSLEVVCKLLQSYIGLDTGPASAHWPAGKDMIYVVNSVLAVVATAGCSVILSLPPAPEERKEATVAQSWLETLCSKVSTVVVMLVTDPKMPLMLWTNVSFGGLIHSMIARIEVELDTGMVFAYINSHLTGVVVNYFL